MCIASLVTAESLFVDVFGNPTDGPYLSVVGVAAELEIDACSFGLFQVIGLVVEQDGVFSLVDVLGNGL